MKAIKFEDALSASRVVARGLLHASRDCLRNNGFDTGYVKFRPNDGYYGEAFGIARALAIVYEDCVMGPDVGSVRNSDFNVKQWFNDICEQVLHEEGYYNGTHQCDHCLTRWGKDGAGRKRHEQPTGAK